MIRRGEGKTKGRGWDRRKIKKFCHFGISTFHPLVDTNFCQFPFCIVKLHDTTLADRSNDESIVF